MKLRWTRRIECKNLYYLVVYSPLHIFWLRTVNSGIWAALTATAAVKKNTTLFMYTHMYTHKQNQAIFRDATIIIIESDWTALNYED